MTFLPDRDEVNKIRAQTIIAIAVIMFIHLMITGFWKCGVIPYGFYTIEWKVAVGLIILVVSSGPIRMGIKK